MGRRIRVTPGVHIVQFHAVCSRLIHRKKIRGAAKPLIIDIGNHQQTRSARPVHGIIHGTHAHRPRPGEYRRTAALHDTHRVAIDILFGMIHGMEGSDNR